MSKEIACYSLDIPVDEFFDGTSCVPNYQKFEKMATAIPPALDGGLRLPKA